MWGLLIFMCCMISQACSISKTDDSDAGTGPNHCPAGQFYSASSKECLTCTGCSGSNVVRRPCSDLSDTICGPFEEFEFFRQHVSSDTAGDGRAGSQKTEVHLTIYNKDPSGPDVAIRESEESQHWKKVAFALIGALSALIFLGTLVVLVICRRINLSRTPAARDGDDDDVDCPYVVIHTIRPSATSDEEATYQVPPGPNALHQLTRQRQRLYKYRPKRRLLPANEYADDVFESEDSSGSRRRISLQVIPETGHSDNESEPSPNSSSVQPASPINNKPLHVELQTDGQSTLDPPLTPDLPSSGQIEESCEGLEVSVQTETSELLQSEKTVQTCL